MTSVNIFLIIILLLALIAVSVSYRIKFNRLKDNLKNEFAKKEERLLTNAIHGQELLRSQIQPHFIYNVLNTIKYLCKRDSDEALIAIDAFSDFLRESMDAFSKTDGIPLNEELEIVKNYVFLEKKRFGDKVEAVFLIECDEFTVPALSIQVLVENAIKHGITKRLGGGFVQIITKETPKEYSVIVKDNGVGFYENEIKNDNKTHVGIENTNHRLELMYNGWLEIKSIKDSGTEAIMHLPKRGYIIEDS